MKNNYVKHLKNLFFFSFVFLLSTIGYGQITSVKGSIIDASSKLPVPFASVYFKGGKGVTADSAGRFEIFTDTKATQLIISNISYKTAAVAIDAGKEQTINIQLHLDA